MCDNIKTGLTTLPRKKHKKISSVYKIFIFVLLSFRSLFTISISFDCIRPGSTQRAHTHSTIVGHVRVFSYCVWWPLCFRWLALLYSIRFKGREERSKKKNIKHPIQQHNTKKYLFISSFRPRSFVVIVACLYSISWQCQFFSVSHTRKKNTHRTESSINSLCWQINASYTHTKHTHLINYK